MPAPHTNNSMTAPSTSPSVSSSSSTASSSSSSSSCASSPVALKVYAAVVGMHMIRVTVTLGTPISTLLEEQRKHLRRFRCPDDITAYVARCGSTWLQFDTPEYRAIEAGDGGVAAKYFVPSNQLDPTKTVGDYLTGDALDKDYAAIHVVLWFSPAAQIAFDADAARHRARVEYVRQVREAYFRQLEPVVMESEEKVPSRQSQVTQRRLVKTAAPTTPVCEDVCRPWWQQVMGSLFGSTRSDANGSQRSRTFETSKID